MATSMRWCARRDIVGMFQNVKFLNRPNINIPSCLTALCSSFNTSAAVFSDNTSRWVKIGPIPKSFPEKKVRRYTEDLGKIKSWRRPLLPFNSQYALVTFKKKDDAKRAAKDMSYLDGVRQSVKKKEVVYVQTVRPKATHEDIKIHFSKYGDVENVWTERRWMRHAFVQFEKKNVTKYLLKKKALRIENRKLPVRSVIKIFKRSEETAT